VSLCSSSSAIISLALTSGGTVVFNCRSFITVSTWRLKAIIDLIFKINLLPSNRAFFFPCPDCTILIVVVIYNYFYLYSTCKLAVVARSPATIRLFLWSSCIRARLVRKEEDSGAKLLGVNFSLPPSSESVVNEGRHHHGSVVGGGH